MQKARIGFDNQHTIPVDGTAANVVFKGGFSEKFKPKGSTFHEDAPCITKRTPSDTEDLTGVKFGRLTVIALQKRRKGTAQKKNGGTRKASWLCKCVCGAYVLRSSRAIKNTKNSIDACGECRQLASLRKKDHYRSTGRHIELSKFY